MTRDEARRIAVNICWQALRYQKMPAVLLWPGAGHPSFGYRIEKIVAATSAEAAIFSFQQDVFSCWGRKRNAFAVCPILARASRRR
jgi:hypothetical protein